MTWFETLTGVIEESPEQVREHLVHEQGRIKSLLNGRQWRCGTLETASLAELRERVGKANLARSAVTVREIVANAQELHCDVGNAGAMFQVASQFNLLEMASPNITPEEGVGIYQHDFTQGPACAIAAGAGTIFRNYFLPVNGEIGQTSQNQVDCLRDLGNHLGNTRQRLWQMLNGYALPSRAGLAEMNERLSAISDSETDQLRGLLRVGVHSDTQVTVRESSHLVSQCFCSAMPVAYTGHSSSDWAPLATLILEAAYEATICAAIENSLRTGVDRVYLTLLGGGAFGNMTSWILNSISRALLLHADSGLDVSIVSFGRPQPKVRQLAERLNDQIRNKAINANDRS